MLNRLDRAGARASDERLKGLFQKELERISQWMATQPNFRELTVAHRDCIADPALVAGP